MKKIKNFEPLKKVKQSSGGVNRWLINETPVQGRQWRTADPSRSQVAEGPAAKLVYTDSSYGTGYTTVAAGDFLMKRFTAEHKGGGRLSKGYPAENISKNVASASIIVINSFSA